MDREREVRTETDFWGNEREVIYEDGEKAGEYRLEERGGLLGFGAETQKVEYDRAGTEIGYSRQEERGGFLGIGTEEVEVTYSPDHLEQGHSKVEERGGFLGIGTHYARIGYDAEGKEVSGTRWERRGGFLGLGEHRARTTRYRDGSSIGSTSKPSRSHYASDDGASTTRPSTGSGITWVVLAVIGLAATANLGSNEAGEAVRGGYTDQMDTSPYYASGSEGGATIASEPAQNPPINSPSFECTKATTEAEERICGSPVLSIYDSQVGQLYWSLRDRISGDARRDLLDAQREWLRRREDCLTHPAQNACMAIAYQDRLGQLRFLQEQEDERAAELTGGPAPPKEEISEPAILDGSEASFDATQQMSEGALLSVTS